MMMTLIMIVVDTVIKKKWKPPNRKFLKFQIWVKRAEDLDKMLWNPFEVSL